MKIEIGKKYIHEGEAEVYEVAAYANKMVGMRDSKGDYFLTTEKYFLKNYKEYKEKKRNGKKQTI